MKSFFSALTVLTVLFGLAAWNCVYVQRAGTALLDAVEALPEEGAEVKEEIENLRRLWDEKKTVMELSVRRELLNAAELALINVETLRGSEENADYLAAKDSFRLAVQVILRLEHPSLESVF